MRLADQRKEAVHELVSGYLGEKGPIRLSCRLFLHGLTSVLMP